MATFLGWFILKKCKALNVMSKEKSHDGFHVTGNSSQREFNEKPKGQLFISLKPLDDSDHSIHWSSIAVVIFLHM